MRRNQPSLPVNRAFAVQIHIDAKVDKAQLKGRVEHVTSGQASYFGSLEELQAFIIQVITKQQKNKGGRP